MGWSLNHTFASPVRSVVSECFRSSSDLRPVTAMYESKLMSHSDAGYEVPSNGVMGCALKRAIWLLMTAEISSVVMMSSPVGSV